MQKVLYLCAMFVKTQKRDNGKVTILIVKNVRSGIKVHQKTLRTVAIVFPEEVSQFTELAHHIKTAMEVERVACLFPVQTLADMVITSRNCKFDRRESSSCQSSCFA